MSDALRVAMVMPPITAGRFDDVVDGWPTVTSTVEGLHRAGVEVTVHGRTSEAEGSLERGGVRYRFHPSDAALAAAVSADRPNVVHVHGLGWTRLLRRLAKVQAPLLLQHHGEPVFSGRARVGHRWVRRSVAGYLFTGAAEGQVQPWIDAGVIEPGAPLFEVLEAASMLPDPEQAPEPLAGAPAVLWVGRLIAGKDPLTAVEAFALAALPDAQLHMLATDRTMEAEVRARIAATASLRDRVHLHAAVPHQRMAAWYRGAHIYFSTSHREGSGYSLIEAMACGCVPVVSAIPPHRAIAGDVGAQFPVADAPAAAKALENASWRSGEPSLERSRIVLSWEHVAGQLVAAYDTVARRRD